MLRLSIMRLEPVRKDRNLDMMTFNSLVLIDILILLDPKKDDKAISNKSYKWYADVNGKHYSFHDHGRKMILGPETRNHLWNKIDFLSNRILFFQSFIPLKGHLTHSILGYFDFHSFHRIVEETFGSYFYFCILGYFLLPFMFVACDIYFLLCPIDWQEVCKGKRMLTPLSLSALFTFRSDSLFIITTLL